MKDLQRDSSVLPKIPRQAHSGHAPTAELSLDHVAIGQRPLQSRAQVRSHEPFSSC